MSFNNENIAYLENSDFSLDGKLVAEALDVSMPVVVMLYGTNCPHCHHAMPEYAKLSKEYPDLANYTTIVTDSEDADQDLLQRIQSFIPGIQGVPTFVLFRNGVYVKTHQGERTVSGLKQFIET